LIEDSLLVDPKDLSSSVQDFSEQLLLALDFDMMVSGLVGLFFVVDSV